MVGRRRWRERRAAACDWRSVLRLYKHLQGSACPHPCRQPGQPALNSSPHEPRELSSRRAGLAGPALTAAGRPGCWERHPPAAPAAAAGAPVAGAAAWHAAGALGSGH